jgi:hypothetical protein
LETILKTNPYRREEKRKIIIILIKEIEEAKRFKRRIKKNKSGPSLSYFVDLEISAAISGRKGGGEEEGSGLPQFG